MVASDSAGGEFLETVDAVPLAAGDLLQIDALEMVDTRTTITADELASLVAHFTIVFPALSNIR